MNIHLTALDARLLGCLIEKEITTPDQYPLSLNALLAAANQKNNRDPVLSLSEREVQFTVDSLQRRHLVVEKSGFGSRVPKYQHRFCNTEYGSLKFTAQELALVCELMLRGAQTPGELRSRAGRMAEFADAAEVEKLLEGLAARSDGPFVVRLAREPGRREARYAATFIEGSPQAGPAESPVASATAPGATTRTAEVTSPDAAPGARRAAAVGLTGGTLEGDDTELSDHLGALERRLAELEQRIAQLEGAQRATPQRD
jgi:uncharacterized protein YceH (UPF0502 family)